jgi:hypothetical protein
LEYFRRERLVADSHSGARKQDSGSILVNGAPKFLIAEFPGQADGRGIFGMDEANGAGVGEVAIAPAERLAESFAGVALAMDGGRENPSRFGRVPDGWLNVRL